MKEGREDRRGRGRGGRQRQIWKGSDIGREEGMTEWRKGGRGGRQTGRNMEMGDN